MSTRIFNGCYALRLLSGIEARRASSGTSSLNPQQARPDAPSYPARIIRQEVTAAAIKAVIARQPATEMRKKDTGSFLLPIPSFSQSADFAPSLIREREASQLVIYLTKIFAILVQSSIRKLQAIRLRHWSPEFEF
jgi:hypothetical protein